MHGGVFMERAVLKANLREKAGSGKCNQIRRNNKVPGIIYGEKINNLLVEFSDMDLNNFVRQHGEHAVLEVDVDGKKLTAMIKEVQRDPVNRKLTHIDMKYIDGNEKIHADVPIVVKGEEWVRSKGGIVQKQLGTVSVETYPNKLPKYVVADVSNLNIGDKLSLADVEFSSDITVLSDIESIIATIVAPKEKAVSEDVDEVQLSDNSSNEAT